MKLSFGTRAGRTALVLAAVLAIGGCAETMKPVAQCEPGVTDLSRTADLVPGNC